MYDPRTSENFRGDFDISSILRAPETCWTERVAANKHFGFDRFDSSENTISSKVSFCQTLLGLGTLSMFGRALHRQPGVGSPQPQEEVPRPAGVRHLCKWNLQSLPRATISSHEFDLDTFERSKETATNACDLRLCMFPRRARYPL